MMRSSWGAVLAVVVLPATLASVPSLAGAAGFDAAYSHRGARISVRAHTAIIGGSPASQGTFQWLAYIEHHGGRKISQCTGAVVAPSLVLTAAHCAEEGATGVERDPAGYLVGTGNVAPTTSGLSSLEVQVSRVSEVIVYPGYDPNSGTGDAALLVLATPTTAPAIPLAANAGQVGSAAKIAGWGLTEYGLEESPPSLQWADTMIQRPEVCERAFRTFNSATELCVMDTERHAVGPCEGDSGGPLIVETPTGAVEVGVTHLTANRCPTDAPSAYARTDVLAPWAQEAMGAFGPLSQAVAERLPIAATPGVYSTVRSSTHKVAFRVASDGRHLVHLTGEATVGCQNGSSVPWQFSAFVRESESINGNVLRATLEWRGNRLWGPWRARVYLHFNGSGLAEGRLRMRVKSKRRHVGLCYAPSIRFWAYRAGS